MADNMSPFVWQTIAKECSKLEHFTCKFDIDFEYFITNPECKEYLSELLKTNLALTTIEIVIFPVSEDDDDVFAADEVVNLFEIFTNSCPHSHLTYNFANCFVLALSMSDILLHAY
jgi:hypothetical protein